VASGEGGLEKLYFIYILAKGKNSTFYTGLSENLIKRIREHKDEVAEGFTKKYGVKTLVYYEACSNYEGALFREKQLKKWRRESKMKLVESINPYWDDLFDDICR